MTETGYCPHCGKMLTFRHEQKVVTKFKVLIQGDCINADCKAFGSTMTYSEREMTDAERADAERFLAKLNPEKATCRAASFLRVKGA